MNTARMPVYLDHAATTPVEPLVAARMAEVLSSETEFGNPASSSHGYGDVAAALVESARAQVAAAVGAAAPEIVWTSGATEANNLAIFGVAQYYRERGRHIVTSRTEHKAVLDPCRELERRGWEITYLVPDREGLLDPAQVAAALRPDTVLVSLMHVNNEIGVVQNIAAVGAICARHGGAWLHVDAAQSVGKCPLHFASLGADLMSLSSHKVYGPKGVGALVISRGADLGGRGRVQLSALQFGGGQERALRAGTLPTHQVVGMGLAFELAAKISSVETARVARLRERLWRGLASLGGVVRNGSATRSVPHLLNVSFEGVEGESLLAAIRPYLAVSTGSACTSALAEPSYVLRALGRSERLSESSLRFGLGRTTTEADVDIAIACLTQALSRLRKVAGTMPVT
ncbi:MAG TPA: aminotransferase class V-fold PLP-dependent enzyme [Steroidobacteraceae bacterium]|jgi:cysteine desulfurase|nr:aminotransferase class V-fold PLP-dependent enzyme [Steroidobacteraceae bacterium]